MKSKVDMEKEYGVDSWADVELLACRSDMRVSGLGTALVKRAVGIMEERGVKVQILVSLGSSFVLPRSSPFCIFQVITGHASSHFSSRIFQKVGFTEVFCQRFVDYKVEGRVVFPTTEPHTHARLYVRA